MATTPIPAAAACVLSIAGTPARPAPDPRPRRPRHRARRAATRTTSGQGFSLASVPAVSTCNPTADPPRRRWSRASTASSALSLAWRSFAASQAAYAAERARVLFGSYRRGDANDPDAYVAAITAVLSIYSTDLIREVTDPRTGICTAEKYMSFMPNAGELKVYCDGVLNRRAGIERLGAMPKPDFSRARLAPPPSGPGARATTFIASNHPRYVEAVEWTRAVDDKFWRAGESDDGRRGVWVCFEEFSAPPITAFTHAAGGSTARPGGRRMTAPIRSMPDLIQALRTRARELCASESKNKSSMAMSPRHPQ